MDKYYNNARIWFIMIVVCLLYLSGCLSKDHMPTPHSGDYEGKVIDPLTAVAVPNVTVTIGSEYKTVTDSKGEFIFSTLSPGDYQVSLTRDWYQGVSYQSKHVGKDIQWNLTIHPEMISGGLVYYANPDKEFKNELFYLNLTTRQVIKLLQTTDSETDPVAAKGSLFYDSDANQTQSGYTDIYQYTPGIDSRPERLFPTLPNSGHPSFSVDGNTMVFQSKQGETWYVMLQRNGGLPEKLIPGENPVISPDGNRIAYLKSDILYIYNLADNSYFKCSYSGKVNHPSWYPVITDNGNWKLLVEAWPGSEGRHRIFLITSDDPDQLQAVTSTYGIYKEEDHHHPGWSEDGKIIFFSANILFSSRKDLYCLRWADFLASGQAAQWIMVSPGSGSKNNPSWAGKGF